MKEVCYVLSMVLLLVGCTNPSVEKQVIPSASSYYYSPTSSSTAISTSTSVNSGNGIKTYTNTEKGYSYKYANNWIEKGGDLFEKEVEGPPTIKFEVQTKDYFKKYGRGVPIDASIGAQTTIGNGMAEKKIDNLTIGIYKGAKYMDTVVTKNRNDAVDSLVVRIDRGDDMLEIRLFMPGRESENTENIKVFNSVVTSITF